MLNAEKAERAITILINDFNLHVFDESLSPPYTHGNDTRFIPLVFCLFSPFVPSYLLGHLSARKN